MTLYENNANGLERRDAADGDILLDRNEICGVYDTLIYVGKCLAKHFTGRLAFCKHSTEVFFFSNKIFWAFQIA